MQTNYIINANWRPYPIMQEIASELSSRIVTSTLPCLNLNPTTAKISLIGMGTYKIYGSLTCIQQDIADHNTSTLVKDIFQLATIVSSVALAILCPDLYFFFSNSAIFIPEVAQLINHIYSRDWEKVCYSIISINYQIVHVASVVYGTPVWMALSLISQAIHEMHQALKFEWKGQRIEALAYMLIALFRAHQARFFIKRDH